MFGSFAGMLNVIATADGELLEENGFIYDIVGGNAVITGYTDTAFTGQIDIPDNLGGYTVTEIGKEAFRGCQCTSVNIPATVTEIHPEAFAYDMPNLEAYYTERDANGQTGDYFANNGILYKSAFGYPTIFAYPKNLPQKTFKATTGFVMGAWAFAFSEVRNLEEIIMTGYQFTAVDNYAFYGAKDLKKVTIDNCIYVGGKAFADCEKLDKDGIDIDFNSLLMIGPDAFENTAFANDLSNYDEDGVLYYGNCLITSLPEYDREYYEIKDGTYVIAGGAFDWDSLEEVYIPGSVVNMNSNPFFRCENLKSFNLGGYSTVFNVDACGVLWCNNTIVSYPNGRFRSCYVMPTNASEVAEYAFYGSPVRNFYIPEDTNLSNCSLGGTSVTDIHYGGGPESWKEDSKALDQGYGEFSNAIDSANIRLDSYSEESHTILTKTDTKATCSCGYEVEFEKNNGEYSENGFTYRIVDGKAEIIACPSFVTGDLVIPELIGGFVVASIAENAFDAIKCKSVYIPSAVENIDANSGLWDINNLERITVATGNINFTSENGILYNKDKTVLYLFPDAKTASEFTVPENVERIFSNAFKGNRYLVSLSINGNLETIEADAFSGCAKLESLDIRSGVDYIGDRAFRYCYKLATVNLTETIGYIGKDVFQYSSLVENDENYNDRGVIIRNGCLIASKEIGGNAFAIPEGTTVIAAGVFSWQNIETVQIPSSVVTVGDAAFNACPKLEEFYVSSGSKYLSTDENGALYNKDKTVLIAYPPANRQACFFVPEGVTEIRAYALDYDDMLSIKYIPSSVTKIGKNGLGTNPDMIIRFGGNISEFVQIDFAGETQYRNFILNVEKEYHVLNTGEAHNSEITVTDPTCSEKGAETITCSCGYKHINTIPKAGHKPAGNVIVLEPATCTTREVRVRYCSVCGEIGEKYVQSSLGHKYVKTEQTVSCDEPGGIFYECSRCGDSYSENFTEPLGHTVTDKTAKVEPTCSEDGGLYKICDVCGDKIGEPLEVYEAKGHAEGEWTVETEASCDDDGKEILPCTVCGEVLDTRVIGKSHDYKETLVTKTCTYEKYRYRCSKCGDEYYRDVYYDKAHGDLEEVIEEPGCFSPGKKYKRCTVCGITVGEVETIPSTGHKFEVIDSKEATCTESGYVKSRCVKCSYTKTETENKLSHTFGKWEYDGGNKFSGICSACGKSFDSLKVTMELDYKTVHRFSGETHKINVTVTENISDDFVFTSSDKSVATVSADGIVTAVAPGRAIITVTLRGTEISTKCTVTVNAKAYLVNWMVGEDVYVVTSVKEGESITPPAPPEMEGFEFAGWSPEIPDIMPSHGIVFTAKFNEVVKSDKHDVSASYEEGCFDEDITLDVNEIETDREPGGVYMVEGQYYDQVGLYNIKAVNGDSAVVQPNEGYKVTIKIALPEAYKHQTEFVIYHRFVGGGREQLSTAAGTVRVENGYLIFEVGSFSEFEVLVPTASIRITQAPEKLVYRYGEDIDLTGIRVVYTDDKGVTKTVTNSSLLTVSGYDSDEIGKQTVTVSYGQHTDSFEVEVRMTFWQWIIKILFFGLIKF